MLWHWVGVGPSMVSCRRAQGPDCWSRPVAAGLVGSLARPLSENLVMDQGRGSAPVISVAPAGAWRFWWLPRGREEEYEFTVAARPTVEGPGPLTSLLPADGSSALAPGSKRGASDRRSWAAQGDVRRMKLLVRRHVATVGYRLDSYGMQEVRGSNPRSSTSQFKALNSNDRRAAVSSEDQIPTGKESTDLGAVPNSPTVRSQESEEDSWPANPVRETPYSSVPLPGQDAQARRT